MRKICKNVILPCTTDVHGIYSLQSILMPSFGRLLRPSTTWAIQGLRNPEGNFEKMILCGHLFSCLCAVDTWRSNCLDPSVIYIFPPPLNQWTHLHVKRALFDCVRPILTRVISLGQPGCVQYGPSCLSKPWVRRKSWAVTSFSEAATICLKVSGIFSAS